MKKSLLFLLPFLISTISYAQPTAAAISVSGGSGSGGAFIVGNTVTAQWDNGVDGATGISAVTFDFTEFGGGPAVVATDIGAGVYEATYTIAAPGTTETTTADVSVTVVATTGGGTTADNEDHTVDDVLPTATVAIDSDPISLGDLAQVVTVTYDEAMDAGTSPTIGFDNSGNFTTAGDGAWSTVTFTNDTWTETFNHDGTAEEIAAETVTVSSSSGATDVAGNADIGNSSAAFLIDTQSPTAIVTIDSDPIFPSDLDQVVTITYDEAMNAGTSPTIGFTNSGNFTTAGDGAWSTVTFANDTWTETFNHDGTSEQFFTETAVVASTSGATDVVGNADIGASSPNFVLDTQAPTAVVTVDSDPINLGGLAQVVTVTYDEAMNAGTSPTIGFTNSGNFTTAGDGAWSTVTFANDTWTETFNHDGTAEEIAAETAVVASSSGATDVVGIADVGDSSPSFVIDTQSPTATVTIDSDPISLGDLAQVVTVTYDEAMDAGTNPTIGFDNSGNFTTAGDGAWSTVTFTNDTWTETFNHDGTAEEIAAETVTVSSSSGATDVAGNADIGNSSAAFLIDTQSPTAIVTIDSDPIFPSDLVQVVTVTYDEAMNAGTSPTIGFTNSGNFTTAGDGAWSTVTFANDTWTETFNHDGTSEQFFTETAVVASSSGATDVVGNADIGASSPNFVLDTQAPTATVTIDSDPISLGDLAQVVTVTYDEAMNAGTNPTIGFDNSGNFTTAGDGAWSTVTFANDTWTETFNHDGTAEEIAAETVTVASASGATDVVGIADIGGTSLAFVIDTQVPSFVNALLYDIDGDGSIDEILLQFTEDIDESSVSDADFNIGGSGFGATTFTVFNSGFPAGNTTDASLTDNYITLIVDLGTTDDHTIAYAQGGLADEVGNLAATNASLTTVDFAPPVLTDVQIEDTDNDGLIDRVVYVFSEIVSDADDTDTYVVAEVGSITLPDGQPAGGFLDGDIALSNDGTFGYVTIDNITGQVTQNTGIGSLNVSGVNGFWDDDNGLTSIGDGAEGYIDAASPIFIDATFYDVTTQDGIVDEILLEFSEDVDESSVDDADFDIGGAGLGSVTFSVTAGASANNGVDANDSDEFITLAVSLNTTDDRTVVYTQNDDASDVVDNNFNQALNDAGVTTIDLAAPVLTELRIEDADDDGIVDQMTYVFSEIVFDIAGGVIDDDIGTLTMPDAATFDGGGGNALGDANVSLTNDGTYGLLIMDVASAGYVTVGTDAGSSDVTGAAVNFEDDQGIDGIEITEAIIDLAKPRIMSVSISGNAIADVTFSEPVWSDMANTAAVGTSNFSFTIGGALTSPSVDGINATSEENPTPNILAGGETDIRIFFSYTGTAAGGETLTMNTDGGIYDDSNNTADATQFPTDNQDVLAAPAIPDMTTAEWLDLNNDGMIDAVAIGFSVDWDIDEYNGSDGADGLDCILIQNNGATVTQDNIDYDSGPYPTNGFFTAAQTVTIEFTGDPQPGTSIANLQVTYQTSASDRIESQATEDDVVPGDTPNQHFDGAAPRFVNFSATILDDNADGNVDRILVDAQDNIDDSVIDPSEFTYNSVAATGIANSDNTDESFTLLFSGNGTAIEGDFIYTPGVSLLDTAANASNGGTIGSGSITDGAGPVILSSLTLDTEATPDGEIDEILVTFSENLANIYGDDTYFSVGSGTYPVTNAVAGGNADEVVLTITESGAFDTFVTPDVEMTIVGFGDDAAGALTPLQTFTNTSDGAAPYSQVDALATADASPDLSGDIDDPNATVLVNVSTFTRTATNNGDGTWSFSNTGSAPGGFTLGALGNYEVTVIGVDPFGNTSTDVTNSELTINGGATITAATPGNLCISDGFQPLGSIQVMETGNGDFGSSGTILLTLPSGFEFNTGATPNTGGSSFTDITVGLSYVGTATLQLTITYDGVDDGIDDLLINGLEVMAVTGGQTGDLERTGGTASLLTTDTNYATLTSNVEPSQIVTLDETVYSSNNTTSLTIRSGLNFTLDATDQAPTTVNWYENVFDGTPEHVGVTATQADLNTAEGLYTYYVANDDGTCDSDPLEFELLLFSDDDPTTGPTDSTFVDQIFIVTDDTDTIYISNPAGHTVNIIGAGTTVTNPGASPSPLLVIFDPAIAGDDGAGNPQAHTITYSITNNSTGASTNRSVTFTVEPETEIFTGPPADEYCSDDGLSVITVDNSSFSGTYGVLPYINRIYVNGLRYGFFDLLDGNNLQSGGIHGPAAYQYNWNTTNFGVPDGQFENVRFQREIFDNVGIRRIDATNYFIIYGTPFVTLTNVGTAYCEDDAAFTINRTTSYVESIDQSNPDDPIPTYNGVTDQAIANGYLLYRSSDAGATYPTLYADFTAGGTLTNTFDPTDPDQDGNTAEATDLGYFRIIYTTEALTPNSCQGTYQIDILVNPDTPTPVLDAATLLSGGSVGFVDDVAPAAGVDDNEYLLEYCVGDVVANFTTSDINTVRWYDDNFNLIANNVTSITPAQAGLSVSFGRLNAEQTEVFYFTSTDATGCESDYRLVTVEVYPIPDAPNVDISAWPAEVVSGTSIFLDYCLPRASSVSPSTITFDPISAGDETYNASVYFSGIIGANLYFLTVSGGAGTFIPGEIVTGGVSGATATVHYRSGSLIAIRDVSGVFVGEGITGSVSGATTTVTDYATRRILNNEFLSTLPIFHIGYLYSSAAIPVPFTIGETVTGGTSGATAVVYRNYSTNYIFLRFTSTTQFVAGEIVTGGSSGSILTVSSPFDNFSPNYRYTVTKTSNINGSSTFAGCEGTAVNVYTYGRLAPTDPTIADMSAGSLEFHVSEGDVLTDITHTFTGGMDNYVWYEDASRNDTISVLTSGNEMTQDILDDAKVDGTKQLITSGGFVADRNDDGNNDVYSYFLTRVDNSVSSRGFDGCESGNNASITLTVHAIQPQPTVVSDNTPGALGTPDFTDLNPGPNEDNSVDHFFSVCSDQLEADIRFVASELSFGGAREFKWYQSTAGGVRGGEILTDGSGNATFSELGLSGLNPPSTINRYFEVIQVTDNDVYAGVESESTFVRVDISPQDALELRDDATDLTFGSDFCRDDASGDITVDLYAGGVSAGSGNVDYDIDSYLESTYITTPGSPEIDGAVTPGNPTLDWDALHDAVTGSQAIGGEPTVHVVTMNYTDPVTLCTGTTSKVITIHPDPHISFEVNGIDINDIALVDEFCYENGNVAIQGVQYIYDNTGIIDTVNLITGQFSSDLTGNLGSNVGQGTFNPTTEHNAAHGVTGTDAKFLNRTVGSDVSLSYTDGFGCERTVSQILFINPEPEVLEVTGLATSDLAASRSTNYIRVTNFCKGAASIDAEIQFVEPLDPNVDPTVEEDSYVGYTFDWTINGNVINQAGDNTVNYVLGADENSLVMTVVVTDPNGCPETFSETHQLQNLPNLDITGIQDFNTVGSNNESSFCADATDPTIGLTDATLDGNSATNTIVGSDVVSWSVDSYSDDNSTPVQIASGAGTLPTIDLDAWHTDGALLAPGSLVGGPSTYHQITIVYQDPSRNYQGIATMCSNTVIETIAVHPDPDISITLNSQDVDDLEFCYDDINITLQGIDLGSGLSLNGGAQNIIRIDGAQVSSNGQATFNAATYHGTNPGDEFLAQSRHTIEYVYQDANGCDRTITRDFLVNPRPRFTGDVIQTASTCATSSVELFVDMTDGASNYTFTWFVNGQEVNGVDVIDEDGNNNDERITYNFGGQLTANFGVTATYIGAAYSTNCVSSIQNQSITVGAEPIPAISWVGITAGNANGTDFTITEDNATLPDGDVDLVELEIDGVVELSVPNPTFPLAFNHAFATSGDHVINLTMNTTAGCDVTLNRTVRVIPHYTGFNSTNSYSESFETAASFDLTSAQGGWLIDSLSLDGKTYYDTASSWTRGSLIPGTAGNIDGTGAVYTAPGGVNGYRQSEVSFVYSPSFDLSSFTAPTVSFLRYEDFETFRDGVVFQVSVDDGRSWQTVGTYNASLESEGLASTPGWYNREAISSSPGSVAPGAATANNSDQVGWALNSDWQEAISPVAINPAQSGFVRFRFALSAQAGAKTTNGFGFDLVRIYERNQIVLLELFSSTLSQPSLIVNDSVNTRPQYAGTDILKINYFTDLANSGSNLDQINQKNTTGPGAKVAFYGVGEVPSLSIAGDANYVDINGNSYSLLNAKLANARLNNPAFDITLNASVDGSGNLIVDADFTATTPFVNGDKVGLFVAVVEPIVTLSSPMGLYPAGATIQNVMRKLLPSAAGQFVNGPIAAGETRSLTSISWPINNMFDPSNIRVIAYAQDLNTKQIYQASSVDLATGLSSSVLGLEDLADFGVYPNPADKDVTVEFASGLEEDTEWVIFDQAGREVLKGELKKGTATMTVETTEMPSGMYFIHLYGEDRKQRAKRIMIVH